ncbi:glycosyltransferase [Desulfobacter postgatei]|uniref:glycosyltransferase family 2 protein n=1 Tax=Desulfobacter postgatei TaxID=2293 RepID=UPI002A37237E|nr:glycosyltransferase [Desulfobacter postgatei]MDX9963484.1 glycosyltransferase [Desulfobacter postgatei]
MVMIRENIRNKNKIAALACILAVLAAVFLYGTGGSSAIQFLKGVVWGRALIAVFSVFSSLALAELVWRIILVLKYRPIPGVSDDQLPTCTIVVPAYNEGRQVFDTLKSLAASNYPRNKIQLIAVDDGSMDDTWKWIKQAKRTLSLPVLTIRQPRNQGKRQALYDGFKKSRGAVLVTVDSDSMVEPDTLRNLVTPFALNPDVGAVAGNVRVLNQSQGIIPRMVDIVFVFSFDFIRVSQSMVRTVTCTPGALSAYRKSVVMGVLDEWRNQTFLGRPANIGEDRAMTNMILRQGYDVVFQQNARVFTEVPVAYTQLCKMYLRWARSNVRETIAMTSFIFTRFRRGSMLGARINLVSDVIKLTVAQLFFLMSWGLILWNPAIFGSKTIVGIVLGSSLAATIYAFKFGKISSILAFVYGFFFFIALSWIKPYALITPHHSRWLTRACPKVNPDNDLHHQLGARQLT